MLTIRNAQLARFGSEQRRQFIAAMCRYLREQFHDELWAVDGVSLHRDVDAAIHRAESYGLHSERDCCRYLNLAVTYGWDFDSQPQNDWMRKILTDTQVTSPSQRLHRLVDQCIYRSEVEESNRRLRLQFDMRDNSDSITIDEGEPGLILATK
jgi:hypothetical protein